MLGFERLVIDANHDGRIDRNGNGVIEAPAIGRDMAKYIAFGEKSLLMERLPLSRFEKEFDLTATP